MNAPYKDDCQVALGRAFSDEDMKAGPKSQASILMRYGLGFCGPISLVCKSGRGHWEFGKGPSQAFVGIPWTEDDVRSRKD